MISTYKQKYWRIWNPNVLMSVDHNDTRTIGRYQNHTISHSGNPIPSFTKRCRYQRLIICINPRFLRNTMGSNLGLTWKCQPLCISQLLALPCRQVWWVELAAVMIHVNIIKNLPGVSPEATSQKYHGNNKFRHPFTYRYDYSDRLYLWITQVISYNVESPRVSFLVYANIQVAVTWDLTLIQTWIQIGLENLHGEMPLTLSHK